MARGISESDVFAAADSLLVRGERPTIERVRQELGRGSPNTVNRMLDIWWARLAERLANKSPEGLPASIVEVCRKLYDELQGHAAQEAARLIATTETQLSSERHQLEQLRQAFAAEKAALTALAESRRTELQDAQKALQAANTRAADAEAALKSERKATTTSEAAAGKLVEERDRRIVELQREIERIRSQWQGNETHWLKEIDHLRGDLKSRQAELDKLSRGADRQRADFESRLLAEEKRRQELEHKCRSIDATLNKERREHIRALKARPQSTKSLGEQKMSRRRR